MRRWLVSLAFLCVSGWSADAVAWGCEGHRAVVMIAERLVPAAKLAAARALLAASPVDPNLRVGCPPVPDDPVAEAATWADDYRSDHLETFNWHFTNLPRVWKSATANPAAACAAGSCAIEAIVAQFQLLTHSADTAVKANALRFILHFVGDLHQPLHSTSNGDRGGNCVPVTFFGQAPQQNPNSDDYSPNLHGIWDSSMIRRMMTDQALADAQALSDHIVAKKPLPASVVASAPTKARVTSWARQAHEVGRTVAYGKLPVAVGMEPATAIILSSCQDNHDIVHRMLALNESIGNAYLAAGEPAIAGQLRLAGVHLASVLKAAFPL